MSPSQLRLFTAKEQTLLVSTESERLEQLSEDELDDLLGRVRRLRNKYSDLHRAQARKSVKSAGRRYAATTSNERTLRKSEVVEDCLSRVARFLSRAARRNSNELKAARLAASRGGSAGAARRATSAPAKKKPPSETSAKKSRPTVSGAQVGSTSARNKKNQATADRGKSANG